MHVVGPTENQNQAEKGSAFTQESSRKESSFCLRPQFGRIAFKNAKETNQHGFLVEDHGQVEFLFPHSLPQTALLHNMADVAAFLLS